KIAPSSVLPRTPYASMAPLPHGRPHAIGTPPRPFGRATAYNVEVSDRTGARVVFSSAAGRICRGCGQPERGCRCGRPSAEAVPQRPGAKPRLGRAGRGGKAGTLVLGRPNNPALLQTLPH